MSTAKAQVMKRQMDLLGARYDLSDRRVAGVTMSRGKPVQDGVRVKLPAGVTWEALAQMTPDVKVIPRHGPISSLEDMRVYVKMLKETREVVQKALKEGRTFDQMKQARILDSWKKYSGDFITEDAYLETLFNSLTGRTSGKFIKHN